MRTKVWLAYVAGALIVAVLLFGAAGTLVWPEAWTFLALFFGPVLYITLMLARHDPALLDERMKSVVQKEQPIWDRIIMAASLIVFPGWLVVMGFDVRFGWSAMPLWLQWIGGGGVTLAMSIMYRTFEENTFLAPVVKIQKERGHRVISTGPYAIVRHPLYSAVLIFFPSTALMLGSWWGLAATIVLASGLVLRTAMEDRLLQRELDGYLEYVNQVRYKLIPRIW